MIFHWILFDFPRNEHKMMTKIWQLIVLTNQAAPLRTWPTLPVKRTFKYSRRIYNENVFLQVSIPDPDGWRGRVTQFAYRSFQ